MLCLCGTVHNVNIVEARGRAVVGSACTPFYEFLGFVMNVKVRVRARSSAGMHSAVQLTSALQ